MLSTQMPLILYDMLNEINLDTFSQVTVYWNMTRNVVVQMSFPQKITHLTQTLNTKVKRKYEHI